MLLYKSHAMIGDLAVGECTMHRASGSRAARWWQLWFLALRETDGQPENFCVPMNPNGHYLENGPSGRTWGLTKIGAGLWQVSPSIDVGGDRNARTNAVGPSLWHQTPQIVGVPDAEPWANGVAP